MKLNFDELEYNLYEILNIPENTSYDNIKKSYKKLILKYHPDKNTNNENTEELFMINTAYKVLKNQTNRDKYDNYLKNKRQSDNFNHINARKNYQNVKPATQEEKMEAKHEFYSQFDELNKKHGYIEDNRLLDSRTANQRMNELKNTRNNFSVDYAPIFSRSASFNSDTFNDKFNQFKNGDSSLNLYGQEIIKSEDNNLPLAYQPVNGNLTQYSPLTDNSYNNLYVEDTGITGDNFSSLDVAFSLKDSNCNFDDKTIEERLKEREKEDDKFKVMGINEFTEDTLEYGILDKIN